MTDTSTSPSHPLDAITFRALMGSFPSGVSVVASVDDMEEPQGATVSAFCSVSLDPPLVLVCLATRSRTLDAIRNRGAMSISFLASGQSWLAQRFAVDSASKFVGLECETGILGLPLPCGTLGYLECDVQRLVQLGDHTAVAGLVVNGAVRPGEPLLYFRREYGEFEPTRPAAADIWFM